MFTVLASLVRGGPKYKSIIGLNACGASGFAVLFVHLLVSIVVSIMTGNKIVEDTKGLIIAGFTGGFLAGLMAISATIILVPVWLKVGVDKDYAGNSTGILVLMASLVTFTIAYFNHVF